MTEHFGDALAQAVKDKNSILVLGLDPQLKAIPRPILERTLGVYGKTTRAITEAIFDFNRGILEAVAPYVVLVKPNIAFYECYGAEGLHAFEKTLYYAKGLHLLCDSDVKRCDGGDTADAYVNGHIGKVPWWGTDDPFKFGTSTSSIRTDAITVTAHVGDDWINRCLDRINEFGTGIFVVAKTSFKPNSRVEQIKTASGRPFWQELADMINGWNELTVSTSGFGSVGAVLGATYPEDAERMRELLPTSWLLVPGYGAQGGGADDAVRGVCKNGLGCIVNSSRGITNRYQVHLKAEGLTDATKRHIEENYAEYAAHAAREARDELNQARERRLNTVAA